jgi:hypothetical protein
MLLCSMPAPPHTPWLRLVILTAFSLRRRSTWCATCLGGARRGLPEEFGAGAVPLGDLVAGEFVLFTSYISCGLALPISPFFLLLLEEFGLQLQHLTPHSILQVAIFVHLCEMFIGVAPCTSLFRYFFVLVKSEKIRDHIGAYYFQTRPDPAVVYIPTFGGARWENWRSDWVIASTEANESCRAMGQRSTASSGGPSCPSRQSSCLYWTGSRAWLQAT